MNANLISAGRFNCTQSSVHVEKKFDSTGDYEIKLGMQTQSNLLSKPISIKVEDCGAPLVKIDPSTEEHTRLEIIEGQKNVIVEVMCSRTKETCLESVAKIEFVRWDLQSEHGLNLSGMSYDSL